MSLPEKIFGILPGKSVWDEEDKCFYSTEKTEECFRYKNKKKLERELLECYQDLINEGAINIHGFMISHAWFTFGGYEDGYTGVKEIDKKRRRYPTHWSVGPETYVEYLKDGKWYKFIDNRPSAAAIRIYAGSINPICYFMSLPVWLLPAIHFWWTEQIVIAVP